MNGVQKGKESGFYKLKTRGSNVDLKRVSYHSSSYPFQCFFLFLELSKFILPKVFAFAIPFAQSKGGRPFSVTSQIVNISVFVGHMVAVTTTVPCTKAAIDNAQKIKLYLQIQAIERIGFNVHSWLTQSMLCQDSYIANNFLFRIQLKHHCLEQTIQTNHVFTCFQIS